MEKASITKEGENNIIKSYKYEKIGNKPTRLIKSHTIHLIKLSKTPECRYFRGKNKGRALNLNIKEKNIKEGKDVLNKNAKQI